MSSEGSTDPVTGSKTSLKRPSDKYFRRCIFNPFIVDESVWSVWESITRNFNISDAQLAKVHGSRHATGRSHTVMLVVRVPAPVRIFFYACEIEERDTSLMLETYVELPKHISPDSVCIPEDDPEATQWRRDHFRLPKLIDTLQEQRLAYRLAVCMATHGRLGESSALGQCGDVLDLIIRNVEKDDTAVNAAIPFIVYAWHKDGYDENRKRFFNHCPFFREAKALRKTSCVDFDHALAGFHAFEKQAPRSTGYVKYCQNWGGLYWVYPIKV